MNNRFESSALAQDASDGESGRDLSIVRARPMERMESVPGGGPQEDGAQPMLSGAASSVPLVGDCMDTDHPVLAGRALIRWSDEAGTRQCRWLAALNHLVLRPGDRVLVVRPGNWEEPLVIGILDGFPRRAEKPRPTGVGLTLKGDESIRVTDPDGNELVEIHQAEGGPVVKLLQRGISVETPGALRLRAESVEIEARAGALKLKAADDVIVRGELIELN